MKIVCSLAVVVLPLLLTSCATPPPSASSFHNTDGSALVLKSVDGNTCQILQPTLSRQETNDKVLNQVQNLPQHETAVIILENYTEPQIGEQFRDRGTPLFVALRHLGYQHIVFVQGTGATSPEGLLTLADYD